MGTHSPKLPRLALDDRLTGRTRLGLRWRIAIALAILSAAMVSTTCDKVQNALGLTFVADSCADFYFWRDESRADSVLVGHVMVGIKREKTTNDAFCECVDWKTEDNVSWISYCVGVCIFSDFDAEIHTGTRYWEIVSGSTNGTRGFAAGSWKLHQKEGKIDKIIDGGYFEFVFKDENACK
ncbi:MAG TPA: hypothetical protein VFH88_15600 [Candidatus Krumholzibacteria bacterium]|nr:hypothetical protein [Candidatus Krumholzibacteria bacterium]